MHWCEEFLHYYGGNAEFPRALSDLYTIKVAKMMERKGDFDPDTKLGLFSCDAAVNSIRDLIIENEDVGKILYKEAFGTAPIGVTRSLVDGKFGNGMFNQWLSYF
ncbi:MAG: hypothetical protein RL497_99, partial [Pseudomonadota bacterium]